MKIRFRRLKLAGYAAHWKTVETIGADRRVDTSAIEIKVVPVVSSTDSARPGVAIHACVVQRTAIDVARASEIKRGGADNV